jgi:hypothetical protein
MRFSFFIAVDVLNNAGYWALRYSPLLETVTGAIFPLLLFMVANGGNDLAN